MRATAPVVMTILIVNVAVWIAQNLAPTPSGSPFDIITLNLGALPSAIAHGEWWRLVTPMFLHSTFGIWHIGLNSYALFIFGPNVEQAFGKAKFLAIYLVSGVTGSVLSYAFGPCNVIGVGASGAIFGIIGALFIFLYNRRHQQFVRSYMTNIIVLIALNLLIGQVIPGIDNLAHLGGLSGGALMALGLDQPSGSSSMGRLAWITIVVLPIVLVVWRTMGFTCG